MSGADDSDVGTGSAPYDQAVDGRTVAHNALADVSLGGLSAFPVDVSRDVSAGDGLQRKAATKIRTASIPPARTP
ncbi:MAG TPA: hypothetical protein VIR00_02100, partial [Micromonosporaceae bacterium]